MSDHRLLYDRTKERWDPSPPIDGVAEAAVENLELAFAGKLKAAGITAVDLARGLGGSESGWRHRLNGNRRWKLHELLEVALAFEVTLPHPLWAPGTGVEELLPEDYRLYLVRSAARTAPALVPTFPWAIVVSDLQVWYRDAIGDGRAAAMAPQVVLFELLGRLDARGLPSQETVVSAEWDSSPATGSIEWPARSVSLCVAWTDPAQAPQGRAALVGLFERAFTPHRGNPTEAVTLLVAPSAITEGARALLIDAGPVLGYDSAKRSGLVDGRRDGAGTIELLAAAAPFLLVRYR